MKLAWFYGCITNTGIQMVMTFFMTHRYCAFFPVCCFPVLCASYSCLIKKNIKSLPTSLFTRNICCMSLPLYYGFNQRTSNLLFYETSGLQKNFKALFWIYLLTKYVLVERWVMQIFHLPSQLLHLLVNFDKDSDHLVSFLGGGI